MTETVIVVYLILVVVLLVISALVSATETALFSLTRARILSYRQSKSALQRIVANLATDYHPTLTALVICNMVTNIAISVINTHLLTNLRLPEWLAVTISMIISVIVLLLFCEIIPKTLAVQFPEKISLRAALPLFIIRRVLAPLIFCADKFLAMSMAVLGRRQQEPLRPAEYATYLDSAGASGAFTADEAELLHNLFALREKTVSTVMVPRIETVGISVAATAEEVRQIIRRTRREFYPVFRRDLDDSESFLSAKKFFLLDDVSRQSWLEWAELIPAVSIPEKAKLTAALTVLRQQQLPASLTVDEYGRVAGVLLLKSIYTALVAMPEIAVAVGEGQIKMIAENTWLLDGAMPLNTFEDLTGCVIPESSKAHNLNGFFCEISGKIPGLGDEITLPGGWTMHAETVSHHRVVKIRVHRQVDAGGEAS